MKAFHLVLLSLPLSCATAGGASVRSSAQELSVEEAFDRVRGSVVTIHTVGRTGLLDVAGQVVTEQGIGSGVLVSRDGRILTAAHVVQTADAVKVEFLDGTKLSAHVVGSVPFGDVALLQLDGTPPEAAVVAPIGDSERVRIGSRAFVVGAPLGISHTLTVGHISARRSSSSDQLGGLDVEVFQTDAAINKGNSGGPLFDMHGEVIGIVSYIVSQTGGYEGLGFAITSDTVKRLLLDRSPFWSGMVYVALAGPYAASLNLPGGRPGLLVQRVAKDSPGERLGLRGGTIPATIAGQELLLGGDVVLEAFGWSLAGPKNLERILTRFGELTPGDTLRVRILRAGKEIELAEKIDVLMPWVARGEG